MAIPSMQQIVADAVSLAAEQCMRTGDAAAMRAIIAQPRAALAQRAGTTATGAAIVMGRLLYFLPWQEDSEEAVDLISELLLVLGRSRDNADTIAALYAALNNAARAVPATMVICSLPAVCTCVAEDVTRTVPGDSTGSFRLAACSCAEAWAEHVAAAARPDAARKLTATARHRADTGAALQSVLRALYTCMQNDKVPKVRRAALYAARAVEVQLAALGMGTVALSVDGAWPADAGSPLSAAVASARAPASIRPDSAPALSARSAVSVVSPHAPACSAHSPAPAVPALALPISPPALSAASAAPLPLPTAPASHRAAASRPSYDAADLSVLGVGSVSAPVTMRQPALAEPAARGLTALPLQLPVSIPAPRPGIAGKSWQALLSQPADLAVWAAHASQAEYLRRVPLLRAAASATSHGSDPAAIAALAGLPWQLAVAMSSITPADAMSTKVPGPARDALVSTCACWLHALATLFPSQCTARNLPAQEAAEAAMMALLAWISPGLAAAVASSKHAPALQLCVKPAVLRLLNTALHAVSRCECGAATRGALAKPQVRAMLGLRGLE